jgi:D-alanyl-D-alanine carboxypeptidase/D-alanyl-D-alanine-endopeptidase (penicillin-binding protein 4)
MWIDECLCLQLIKGMNVFKALFFIAFSCGAFCSCKVTGQVSQKTVNAFLNDTAVRTGHAGISIYDPAAKKYLYNYNAEKNFIPSSNVKLFTLYAGMKYLGDSLVGMRYIENDSALKLIPTGDPTFLHPDFITQPVFKFLKDTRKFIHYSYFEKDFFRKRYGEGWAWDDFQNDFMAEKSDFPIYGNVVSFSYKDGVLVSVPDKDSLADNDSKSHVYLALTENAASRNFYSNDFLWHSTMGTGSFKIPFITSTQLTISLLTDTLNKQINTVEEMGLYSLDSNAVSNKILQKKIYSRPADSLFRPMMFNSDNFFAEQTLLMVSNEKLGYMSDEQIIDTLLKTDFKDLPTKPRWVDGSGLSRYDLYSPKDFIYILNKLQNEFGLARMKRILPTGGQGTLTNYYEGDAGFIYAKTGSMSNNVSLSGYLITKKNKLLMFSVIINNFDGSGKSGRRAIEKLIKSIRETN